MPKATMMASVDLKLAQAYVPDQPYERLFPLDALERETIFPSLYRPYKPKK
jgi:hypothetical protein